MTTELIQFETQRWTLGLEFKPQDLWFGAFWKLQSGGGDIWFCLVPMFPIHFKWGQGRL